MSLLARIAAGGTLGAEEMEQTVDAIVDGAISEAAVGALLMGLRQRGETAEELAGAARALRRRAVKVAAPPGAVDCCGTGGDGLATLNVSTAVALVVAGCGVPVAKHGNRAASSRSGAADVMEVLGLAIDPPVAMLERSLAEAGCAFLFAAQLHPALGRLAALRRQLGFRTLLNLVAPLASPAGVRRQLVGVAEPRWCETLAETLAVLGAETAWVVHGADGMDELSTVGDNLVAELKDGAVHSFALKPEDAGLPRARLADLAGGLPAENAAALRQLLDGAGGAYRDIVLFNAAALLIVAGRERSLRAAVALAAEALDSGAARRVLDRMVRISQDLAAA